MCTKFSKKIGKLFSEHLITLYMKEMLCLFREVPFRLRKVDPQVN